MKSNLYFIFLFSFAFLFMQCSEDKLMEAVTPKSHVENFRVSSDNLYRGVYLDSLKYIVGNEQLENNMLAWCQYNNFKTLTCYDLYTLLAYSSGYSKMAAFIRKARTQYGIETITACMASAGAFTGLVNNYNASRTDPIEKFNYSNLELEWWNKASTFKNYIKQLQGIKAWGDSQNPRIPTEEYMGWFKNPNNQDSTQAAGLVENSDRIMVHAYQTIPSLSYMKDRLKWIGKAAQAQNKVMPIILLFSAEQAYSFNYFTLNSFDQTFNMILNQYDLSSFPGKENLEIIGYQIFAQSDARQAQPMTVQ